MIFLNPLRMQEEWAARFSGESPYSGKPLLHDELRRILQDFDEWSKVEKYPELTITQLGRTPEEQVQIYSGYWTELMKSERPGPNQGKIDTSHTGKFFRPLTASDAKQLARLNIIMRDARKNWLIGRCGEEMDEEDEAAIQRDAFVATAKELFTFHYTWSAADIRSKHYSPAQLDKVKRWFQDRCPAPQFEFLPHDITAPHLHVGVRDFSRRADFNKGLIPVPRGLKTSPKGIK